MKKLSIAFLIAVAAVAVGAGIASASHIKTKKVTINYQADPYADTFFGEVKSDKQACIEDRNVKVKRKESSGNVTYGSDTSDSNGDYSVSNGFAANGKYFAKVKKETVGNKVCSKKKSDTFNVPFDTINVP